MVLVGSPLLELVGEVLQQSGLFVDGQQIGQFGILSLDIQLALLQEWHANQ